ncbi:hypothetical protein BH11PLA2_BH11PLA2_26770 [soil metagenome]
MPATKTDVNPFQRRPLSRRALDALKVILTLPRQAYHVFRSWPHNLRRLLIGMAILAGIWGGVVAYDLYQKRSQNQAVLKKWNAITEIAQTTGDRDQIIENLNAILEIKPDEPHAQSRKQALETGKSDPTDTLMLQLIYREHLKNNRMDELLRECERRLAYEPRDYYTHFLMAKVYWDRLVAANTAKDTKALEANSALLNKSLDALAMPQVNSVNLNFGALAGSIEMLRATNRNLTASRQMIAERILPLIKAEQFQKADPGTQATMLFLYSEIFEMPNVPQDAGSHWPAASRMLELCLDGAKEKDDVASAGRIANLGGRFSAALTRLKNSNQITEPQRADLAVELEERVRRAWMMVLEKEPKSAPAYIGLIESYVRSAQSKEAIETLVKGIEVLGDQPQLLQMFTSLSILNKRELAGYERLKLAAERNPTQPIYWLLAAQAAIAGERRDYAAAALLKAKALAPDEPNIALMQAVVYTGTDHPHLVLAALSVIPDNEMLRNDKASILFVRALSEIGDTERLDAFLDMAQDVGKKNNTPKPASWAAEGLLQATPATPQRAQKAADYLGGIVDRYRVDYPPIAVLYAQAMAKAAENADGGVDLGRARLAIIACERALQVDPNNIPLNTSRLFLRMAGDKDPAKALIEIDPLLAKIDILLPEQAQVLAMVYNANKMYDDAARVVIPHTRSRPTAGCWTQLGVAYHGQGRVAEAKDALDRASTISMSDRERANYNSARALTRVKQ